MEPILRLNKVSKRFGGIVAADEVCFSVNAGQVQGLIGPNGAGKTTLLNLISGIYECDEGQIYFNERDITTVPAYLRARLGIGRTFQTPRFLRRSTIRENLLLGIDLANDFTYSESYFGKKGMDFEVELNELMQYAGFKLDLDADISTLTYGQMKILEIVRSMLAHPKVILVDEPAAGLNSSEVDNVVSILSRAAKLFGVGILLIEHAMDLVMNFCESIVVINFGEVIASGSPDIISADRNVIEAYLGRDNNS